MESQLTQRQEIVTVIERIRCKKEEEQELARLAGMLRSAKRRERDAAITKLQGMGPAGVDAILAALAEEHRNRWKARLVRLARRTIKLLIVWLILAGAALLFLGRLTQQLTNPALIGAILSMGFMSVSRARKDLIYGLAGFRDPRAVGPLLEAWTAAANYDEVLRCTVEMSLVQLLPTLRADHASLLKPAHRARLNKILRSPAPNGPCAALVKAILKALEQVGDDSSLDAVERLANGNGSAADDPAIRRAAQECLPALRARVAELRTSQTLLRAAAPTAGDLLIPAQRATETRAEVLLRPVAGAAEPSSHRI